MATTTKRKTVMQQVIDVIKTEMERQGLNPTDVARAAGIGRPYLYRVLEGSQVPSIEWMDKVMRSLGIVVKFEKNPQ